MTRLPTQSSPPAPNSEQSGLEVRRIDANSRDIGPTLVFLHEGLGSVSAWQDFPDRLCRATGLPGLVYSRQGYGRSPALRQALSPDFLHLAATEELAELLALYRISEAVLVGHSDGASIAIVGASQSSQSVQSVCRIVGVIAIAPHLFIEEICITAIQNLADRIAREPERLSFLASHHDDPETIFNAWSKAWLDPAFHALDLSAEAAGICCPVLAVQGDADQYGSLDQIRKLAALAPDGQSVEIPNCRHSPHLEAPDRLLAICKDFLGAITRV